LRSIALQFSLAWCVAAFGLSDACLGCCFQEVKELRSGRRSDDTFVFGNLFLFSGWGRNKKNS
ncbi:MAG: hypothetical protein SPJ98_02135, partial [Sodaliphilus sp.]|nr:hypothetical protein [Sodaliphilus sp.]